MYQDAESHPETFIEAHQYPDRSVDWDVVYKDYDASVDWPTAEFIKRLIEKYPEAKVVFTVRDADAWITSMQKTIFQSLTIPITSEKGKRVRTMSKAVIMDGIFDDIQPGKEPDAEVVKEKYNAHNAWVRRSVPSERLLVLDLGEGWDRLCTFLEMPVPDVPYPHSNSGEEFTQHCKEGNHPYLK